MVTATVISMDTVTEGGVHPWMVMDGQGYCNIHGHCDRGVCTVVSVHGWSMDGHGYIYYDIHGHCDRGVCTVVSIHGWSGMVTATVTSMDTVTEGYAQWCPSMDGQEWSRLLQHPWTL